MNQTNNLILPIAACCKELHQVEDLTSQLGTIGTNLASRPSTAPLLYLSLFKSLSLFVYSNVFTLSLRLSCSLF